MGTLRLVVLCELNTVKLARFAVTHKTCHFFPNGGQILSTGRVGQAELARESGYRYRY